MKPTNARVFVDTNVFVYLYSGDESAKRAAAEDMQHGQVIDGALTIQSPFVPAARRRQGEYRVKARRALKKPGLRQTRRGPSRRPDYLQFSAQLLRRESAHPWQ